MLLNGKSPEHCYSGDLLRIKGQLFALLGGRLSLRRALRGLLSRALHGFLLGWHSDTFLSIGFRSP